MRSSRRSGASLSSVGVGRVELLGTGSWHPPTPANFARRVIAVGSAGGRVGSSVVAAHLAATMANLGAHVIAVDMNLRSPSLHTLFGMDCPAIGLRTLLDREIANLDPSLTRTSVRNLALITGGVPSGRTSTSATGSSAPVGFNADQKRMLMHQICALDGDVVILDLGTGPYDELADSFSLAATNLLVASPRMSSLAASFEFLSHTAGHTGGSRDRPTAASPGFDGLLVGNLANTSEEVELFHAFSRLARVQLDIELPVAGCVRTDSRLVESASLGRIPLVGGGLSESGRAFHLIAEALLHQELPEEPDATADDPISLPITEASLTSHLDRYRRKHIRHDVDWAATLRSGNRDIAVRVVDISLSGAALEVVSELQLGEAATLIFDQLPGRPELAVVVKSLNESIRRAGLAFCGDDAPRRQVVEAADARSRSPKRP